MRRRQTGADTRSQLFKGAGPKGRAICAAAPYGCCGAQPMIRGSRTHGPCKRCGRARLKGRAGCAAAELLAVHRESEARVCGDEILRG